MKINEADEIYNQETVNDDCHKALFSVELISLCLKKLLAFIEEYKIKELPNEEKIGILIDDYNKNHKHKLRNEMLGFFQRWRTNFLLSHWWLYLGMYLDAFVCVCVVQSYQKYHSPPKFKKIK